MKSNREYSFTPTGFGWHRLWRCDECCALVDSGEDALKGHMHWHDEIEKRITIAAVGL